MSANGSKMYTRGSEWRKCDLHVHSLNTHLDNGYGGATEDDFVKKITDQQIEVVGLTNYFNFTPKDLSLKTKLEKSGVKVFLNLELRLTYQNKEDDCCDLHILFDSNIAKDNLESFLTKLNVTDRGTEKIAKNLNNTEEFKKAIVEFVHLLEVLNEESLDLADKYLIGFLSRGKGNSRSSTNYEKIAKKSHFLIHSSDKIKNVEEDRSFWLTKEKPLLQSSDAHKLEDLGKKFTWIKADPTFNGLKQIIYEPKDRIKIQQLRPETKASHHLIDRVEYKNKDNEIETVCFNQNLNSIIGSRATGKSNLLKNIAYSIDPTQCEQRDVRPEKNFLAYKDFKVYWLDKTENTISTSEKKEKGLLFIPQRYLGELVYEDNRRFDKFITDLFQNREDFQAALNQYKNFENENHVQITSMIREILSIKSEEGNKTERLKKIGNKKNINEDIKKTEDKIKKLGKISKVKDLDLKKHTDLNDQITAKQKGLSLIESDIQAYNLLKGTTIISSDVLLEFNFSPKTLKRLKDFLSRSDENLKEEFIEEEIKSLKTSRVAVKKKLVQLGKYIKPLVDKISKNKALLDLTEELNKEKKTKEKASSLGSEVEILRRDYKVKKDELIKKYLDFETGIKKIDIDLKELKYSKVRIVGVFDTASLIETSSANINYHNSTIFRNEKKGDYPKTNSFLNDPVKWEYSRQNLIQLLNELLTGILSGLLQIKSGRDIEGVLASLFKNRFKIDFVSSVKSTTGTHFNDMSDGEQMLTLLEFIFKFDDYNYPVLLDQPEDDIDSRAISTTIVDFMKEEKKSRQIIIASHNANLVVCGDSEEVLISKKGGRKDPSFTYKTGSIEKREIANDIIDILEGGEKALKKRMQKLEVK